MTKKQEKIKEAYGQYWDLVRGLVRPDGSLAESVWFGSEIDIPYHDYSTGYLRPDALRGIFDNNGWISIESEADLPMEDDCGYFILKNEKPEYWYWPKHETLNSAAWLSVITHWQKIEHPKPPIY